MIRASLASGMIRASGLGLSLLANIVMARLLLPEGYGLYAFVLATVAMLTIPTTFGLPTLVVRETARAMKANDKSAVWRLWEWAQRWVLLASLATLPIGALWLFLTANPINWRTIVWGGALAPVLSMAYLRAAAIRGLNHPLLGQAPETILRPAAVILTALLFYRLQGQGFSAESAIAANVIGTTISFLLGVVLLFRLAPPRPVAPTAAPARGTYRAWTVAALTIGLANGVQAVGANTDIMFLGALRPASEVGLYKVALSGASLVGFGLQAVNMVLMPRIAALHHAGDKDALASTVRHAARLIFQATLLITAVLVIFGQWFIALLFGPLYEDAYRTLLIVAAGQFATATFGPQVALLNMTGHEKQTLRITIGFAMLNAALNAILVPLAGMEGAALATSASLVVFNVLLWRVSRRTLGIDAMACGK